MGGLAILFVVGLYVVVALWFVIKSPGWWRLVALLAAVLIPTADAMWGRYVALPRLCKDAGLKVYGNASKQEGLFISGPPDDYFLTKYGFAFVEGADAVGTVYRHTIRDGAPLRESNVKPRARYALEELHLQPSPTFVGTAYQVRYRDSGKLVSEFSTYTYLGGWAERLLGSFTDSGPGAAGGCGHADANARFDQLMVATFRAGE